MNQRYSREVLDASLEHLRYEWDMLRKTYYELSAPCAHQEPVKYALLESFLIHARCIYDFFYKSHDNNKRHDDVLAIDYLAEDVVQDRLRPKPPGEITDCLERINKEVAHVTASRVDRESLGKDWNVESLFVFLDGLMQDFHNRLKNGCQQIQPSAPRVQSQVGTVTCTATMAISHWDTPIRQFPIKD